MLIVFLLLLLSCSDEATFSTINHNINANIRGELHTEFLSPDSQGSDKLDILLIIDGSDSMAETRETLGDKLTPLLSAVEERTWQIAIATTNSENKCLRALINNQTPDYQRVYLETIADIESEANSEQAIKMVVASLRGLPVCGQRNEQNNFWLQDRSTLAILIITDEDHQCVRQVENEECEIEDLWNFLTLSGRKPNLSTKIYGLLNPDVNHKFLAWTKDGESIFTRHEPYNHSDYHELLEQISQQLASSMQFTFDLTKRHNNEASEVVVYFDDDERILDQKEYGFIDDRLIIVGSIPPNTDKIKVTYSYTP